MNDEITLKPKDNAMSYFNTNPNPPLMELCFNEEPIGRLFNRDGELHFEASSKTPDALAPSAEQIAFHLH